MGQNLQFSRGVSPWFWSKICIFSSLCFLDHVGPQKVFHDVLDRKLAFLDDENVEFKKWKNLHFCKG